MRKKFWGYIPLTEEDHKDIWENSKIILDTNILLNLYRYSISTQKEVMRILEEEKDRFIIPDTVIKEFFDNRENEIKKHSSIKKKVLEDIKIENIRNKVKGYRHSSLDTDMIMKMVDEFEEKLKNYLDKCETNDYLKKDPIVEKISDWFDGKIISEINDEELDEIYKEGERRYELNIPPGYEDAKNKDSNRRYNDFIIWTQIVRYAKKEETNILFISDDLKEDWMRVIDGKKVGPREELLNEFFTKTGGMKIYIYSTNGFLSAYANHNKDIAKEVIYEVEEIEKEAMRLENKEFFEKSILPYYDKNQREYHTKHRNNIAHMNESNDIKDIYYNLQSDKRLNLAKIIKDTRYNLYKIEKEISDIEEGILNGMNIYDSYDKLSQLERMLNLLGMRTDRYEIKYFDNQINNLREIIIKLKDQSIPF